MNKKLLKSIVCIGFGFGIATSIPFATTSCRSSSNILPYKVYKYDESDPTILTGFTDEFLANPNAYSNCDTIEFLLKSWPLGRLPFWSQSMVVQFRHLLQN